MGGAITQAKGALSNWWSSMTTVQSPGNGSGEVQADGGRMSKVMEDLEIVTENVLEGRVVDDGGGQGDNNNKTNDVMESVQEVGSEAEEFLESEVEEAKRQEEEGTSTTTTHKAGDVFTV